MKQTKEHDEGRLPYASGSFARESELLAQVQERPADKTAHTPGPRAMAEMEPASSLAAFEQALKAGCYDSIIAETTAEYERGEALASLD